MADLAVQIPGMAVSGKGEDLRAPVRALLEDLDLLGTAAETKKADGFGAAFKGPPQSVALIEAGATAATKWWATGLGATVIAAWTTVGAWWGKQQPDIKLTVIAGAAFLTGAVVVSIGYLLASDVRGRAAAAVANINARSNLAETMIEAAQEVFKPAAATSGVELVPLPTAVNARNFQEKADNEHGWRAIAIERQQDGKLNYILVKGSSQATVSIDKLEFE